MPCTYVSNFHAVQIVPLCPQHPKVLVIVCIELKGYIIMFKSCLHFIAHMSKVIIFTVCPNLPVDISYKSVHIVIMPPCM